MTSDVCSMMLVQTLDAMNKAGKEGFFHVQNAMNGYSLGSRAHSKKNFPKKLKEKRVMIF